ncbi:MAG: hypothetical protein C5B49_03035 [Bdellovibrio sp.]|nr:MAG: hypothetical protein C5B49_03035 [Bdellovibrio sp.]
MSVRARPSDALAIAKINTCGALLVFPIKNQKTPKSLWSEFFPRTPMRWEWDEHGDHRVSDLWHMMKRLSSSRNVVYSKWYQGRATFFSHRLFTAMLTLFHRRFEDKHALQALSPALSPWATKILEILENDAPLSTKELKRMTELQGRLNEGIYNQAMRELFKHLLIVGFGEVEDGAFPSLAVGPTAHLFEDLWNKAKTLTRDEAQATLDKFLPLGTPFRRQFDKNR